MSIIFDRVSLEVARASFMTKSQRLEELRQLFLQVGEQALPPSRYRARNRQELEHICAMARTLAWKEQSDG